MLRYFLISALKYNMSFSKYATKSQASKPGPWLTNPVMMVADVSAANPVGSAAAVPVAVRFRSNLQAYYIANRTLTECLTLTFTLNLNLNPHIST